MVKKPPEKADLRRELDQQVDAFLRRGGEIHQVSPGDSAYSPGTRPPPTPLFNQSKTTRTPVDDVVAALDARQRTRRSGTGERPKKSPRKQVIYDDFGEPLRVTWSDE